MQAMTNLFVRSGNKPWADYDIEACREVMASKVESGRAAARRMRRLDMHGAITVKTAVRG